MIGRLFKRSEPLGEVPVPGEATLALPAGKVSVRYEEDREGRSGRPGDGMPFGRSPELDVTARPAGGGGDPVPIQRASGSQGGAGGDAIWSALGKLEIPTAGNYVVTAGPITETAEAPPARFDPRVVLLA